MCSLNLALLSSYAPSLDDALGNWPDGVPSLLELYAFLQRDLGTLLPELAGARGRPINTVNVLASAFEDVHNTAAQLAFRVHEIVRARRTGNWDSQQGQIVAASTYLPEIAMHEHYEPAWRNAVDAACFLTHFARSLRDDYGHPINVIELVAGSAVDGVWPAIENSPPLISNDLDLHPFAVNVLLPEDAITRFLTRLVPVAEHAALCNVKLAVELEPGPLFTIGSWEALMTLCSKIDEDPRLDGIVGLNLDVAHWGFLAGITPEMVRNTPLCSPATSAQLSTSAGRKPVALCVTGRDNRGRSSQFN